MTTILIAIPCLLTGGTEIQTLSLAEALAQGGYRVVVACYYEFANSMVQRFRETGAIVELLSPDGTRKQGRQEWLHLYRGLKRCVQTYRPALAHVQYMAPGAAPCLVLKLLGVQRIVATTHTDARIYRSLRLLRFIQRHVADAFTCITLRAETEFFGSAHLFDPSTALPKHAHCTIYNALPQHIRIRAGKRRLSATPTIGVVSRLESIKGMDLVVSAFAELHRFLPQARLLVVGDGSLRDLMHRQAEELGVAGLVSWAGRQPQDKLESFYDQIDLFWMPSRSEGFGLSALEAMARGCPVVASQVGGLPELIQNGIHGVLVPAEHPDQLAQASLELLSSTERWQSMACAAQARAADFSRERFASQINNLYGQLLTCTF